MPVIQANGIEQCYALSGDGPQTIVWIHGIGSNHDTWDDVLPSVRGFRHLSHLLRLPRQFHPRLRTSRSTAMAVRARSRSGPLPVLTASPGLTMLAPLR